MSAWGGNGFTPPRCSGDMYRGVPFASPEPVDSISLVRVRARAFGTRSARVLSVSFRRSSDVLAGRYFNRRLRATYPRLSTAELDRDVSPSVYEGLLRTARRQALVIVSTYVTAVSYQGSLALPEEVVDFIEGLDRIGVPHLLVSFGNPYLITSFPDVQAYMLAWSGSEASQSAAARALFGEFDITGRTPASIPPLFDIGAGMTIPGRGSASGRR